jgi:prepilin-type N-terminal cleavage/methylation domain-containing protein
MNRTEKGFTLIELLISILVFIIVTGAIYGLLAVARADRFRTNQSVEILQNMTAALNTIERDALNARLDYPEAGLPLPDNAVHKLTGLSSDTDSDNDTLMGIIAFDNVNQNNLKSTSGSTAVTDQVTFIYRDPFFNNDAGPVRATSNNNGTELTIPTGVNCCKVNQLYLVTGIKGTAVGLATGTSSNKLLFSINDCLEVNFDPGKTGSIASTISGTNQNVEISGVRLVTFKVTKDGTLMREQIGSGANSNNCSGAENKLKGEPLAYGVENMQARYILVDGIVTDNPYLGSDKITGGQGDAADGWSNFGRIRQVNITLTIQSPEVDPKTGYRARTTQQTTITPRNLAYRFE